MEFKNAILKVKGASNIRVISHYDADGLCSAFILKKALEREGKEVNIEIAKQVDTNLISNLNKKGEELFIFSDLGSGYLELLETLDREVIVLDHHQPSKEKTNKNIEHINPILENRILCGAGVSFLFATKLNFKNLELLEYALIGAIGDNQIFEGENKHLLDLAKRLGKVKIVKGLNVFGWVNRPLHKALLYSNIHPFYKDESKIVQFLSEIGINLLNENGKFRTMLDLSEKEKLKLNEELLKEILANGYKIDSNLFKEVILLKHFPRELQDASEFATILNACGRLEKYESAFKIMQENIEEIEQVMKEYKTRIKKGLEWVEKNKNNFPESKKAIYIVAKNAIHENLIGTITSICLSSNFFDKEVILGFANTENEEVKVSARRNPSFNINLGELLLKTCEKVGGMGGGHKEAAGAIIPKEKEYAFIKIFDSLLNGEEGKEKHNHTCTKTF